MKNSQCSVCNGDPGTKIAVDELAAKGGTIRSIAETVKRSRSAVHRHLRHSRGEKRGAASAKSGGRGAASQAGRQTDGRCRECNISVADAEPQSLLRRAERLVHNAELVVERAAADDDWRLQLQALDRVRSALELVMKAVGLLSSDGATTTVDNRTLVVQLFESFPPATIDAFRRGDCPRCGGSLALTDKPALPAYEVLPPSPSRAVVNSRSKSALTGDNRNGPNA